MSSKKRRKGSSGPDPINFLIDLAGAATLGAIAKHKVINDYEKGQGEESARAGTTVFGLGSMRSGSRGLISLGGLVGLNSGIKEIQRREQLKNTQFINTGICFDEVLPPKKPPIKTKKQIRKNMWREYCEDGSEYGLNPNDYFSADDYEDALNEAKNKGDTVVVMDEINSEKPQVVKEKRDKPIWHNHCTNGSAFGISPDDYDNPDDYEEAVDLAKIDSNNCKS